LFTGTTGFGILTPTGTRPNVTIGDGISTNTISLANSLVSSLTINVGATLNGTIRTVTIAGNFTNNGTVTLTTGSLTVTAGTFSSSL
jgi:hypothetical protein